MIAHEPPKTQVLVEADVWRKLAMLDETLNASLRGTPFTIPETPGRDVQILPSRLLPPKAGLNSPAGQARLLHDLASIELQAMELALRTLIEFPEAPAEFRCELAQVASEEGRHLKLCLEGLQLLGQPWGSFSTHLSLWNAAGPEDSLLDRIVLVHRFLEGSGLDASTTIQRRLLGVQAPEATRAINVIARDEVGHVLFGSRWYHKLIREAGLDAEADFAARLQHLSDRVPRRLEPIHHDLRKAAGFTDSEIKYLESLRLSQIVRPGANSATAPQPTFLK